MMYGWRARIGMIMSSVNTTMEPEFNRLAPTGVSVHGSRLFLPSLTVDGMATDEAALSTASQLLARVNARAIAYSCNASNVVGGIEGEAAQARLIAQITDCPAILAASAVLASLKALGVNRVSFATVYPPDLNEVNAAFWTSCGVEVVESRGYDLSAPEAYGPYSTRPISRIGLQFPELAYNLACSVCDERSEAVVVIGGNLRTIEIAERFEADRGIPFISTNIALMWACLQVAGVRDSIRGHGLLLSDQPRLPSDHITVR